MSLRILFALKKFIEPSPNSVGVDFGKAFDVPGHMLRSPIFASICLKNAELDINFGDRPFRHMPKGWTPLSKAKSDNVVPSSITGAAQVANQGPKSNAPMAIIMEVSSGYLPRSVFHFDVALFWEYERMISFN